MLISYSHRFIFFHVAKVAGLSIRDALQPYTEEPAHFKTQRPAKLIDGKSNPLYSMWDAMLTHATAQATQAELPAEIFQNFYKFAFVRNPWDWQVSMYHFLLKETTNPKYPIVKALAGFEEYLQWVINTPYPYPKRATKLQKDMLVDAQGKLLVDYLGRFESLTQDFNQVCQQIGIQAELPSLNQSKHKPYTEYYTPQTRQLVADYYRADIELFGYQFEGFDANLLLQGQLA